MDYQHPRIAEIYDAANPGARDTDFYLSLAGPGPAAVLDLGCGTGTLCCALAERGHRVTGVDPSAAMLAVAMRKPYAERVEWIKSSAQDYSSDRRFDLMVMTGHAFQLLHTDEDVLATLATARNCLNEHGRVAFETRNPRVDWAGEWSNRQPRRFSMAGAEITESLEITVKDGEFISFLTHFRFPHETLTTSSRLRFPSRQKVEELLRRSRLTAIDVFGDWDATPFNLALSREIIFVAQKAELRSHMSPAMSLPSL